MFTALLSPYTLYSGQDMFLDAMDHRWNLGPMWTSHPHLWPAFVADTPVRMPSDLWRAHIRNLGAS